eukprot:5802033-Amphidinium_carterae.1
MLKLCGALLGRFWLELAGPWWHVSVRLYGEHGHGGAGCTSITFSEFEGSCLYAALGVCRLTHTSCQRPSLSAIRHEAAALRSTRESWRREGHGNKH